MSLVTVSISSIFANNTIGTIQATADDPTAGQLGGQIQFTGGGTWSSNYYPTNIVFSNDSSGTLTERMRIDSSGNVGISTNSPEEQLTVGGTGTQGRIGLNTTGVDHPYIQMTQFGSPNTNVTVRIDAGGDSYFNGGDVGVGVTSPSETLHVNGGLHVSSTANLTSGSTGLFMDYRSNESRLYSVAWGSAYKGM